MADQPRPGLKSGGVPVGIVPRIMQSWRAPGRVFADLRGMPDRGLIVVLMAAMLAFLVAQAPGHQRAAQLDPSVPFQARMAGALLAVLFMMPLLAYALAALVSALSRLIRRPVAPADSRLALFWALLAIAPAMLLAGLTEGLVGPGTVLSLTRGLAGLGFLVIWGAGLRALTGKR
jgi:Mn2+/Fe2+ NRAMP family transporter